MLTVTELWPFFETGQRRADQLLSAAMLAVLAVSRLAFLPRGPWEQDEALLACGVMDFDPAHHMPHPPGFPLWIWLGRLVMRLGVGEPLLALQLASAALSLLGLWALFVVTYRWLGRNLAAMTVLAAAFIPGVWFHASRGFSETPSAGVFLVALALWSVTRNLVASSLLVTAAALIRPPLAPFFAVVVLLWAWEVRANPRLLGKAALWSGLLVVLSLGPLILEAGGWEFYWWAFQTHGQYHVALLGTEGFSFPHVGWVRGLGGLVPAVFVGLLSVVGGLWLGMQGKVKLAPNLLAGGFLIYLLLFTHNRTYPRYWVLAWLLCAPLAVAGLRALLRVNILVAAATAGAGILGAFWTYPALSYVHSHPLPVVEALAAVGRDEKRTLVFEEQFFSFRNYLARVGFFRAASLRFSEVKAPKFAVGGSNLFLLRDSERVYLPASVTWVNRWEIREPRVLELSQDRFLRAEVVQNPVLLWDGGSVLEEEDGHPFVWLFPESTLLLPAVSGPGFVTLAVELPPGVRSSQVEAWVGDQHLGVFELSAGRNLITVPVPELPQRQTVAWIVPLRLKASEHRRLAGDYRPLALRVFFVSLEAPPWNPRPYGVKPFPVPMFVQAVSGQGLHAPEQFMGFSGAWCQARCSLSLPLGSGLLQLTLAAPRPGGAMATVRLGAVEAKIPVELPPVTVILPVPQELAQRRRGELVVSTDPYHPPNDPRELSVVLVEVGFTPPPALSLATR